MNRGGGIAAFHIYSNKPSQEVYVRLAFPNESGGDYLLVRSIEVRPEAVSAAACAAVAIGMMLLADICIVALQNGRLGTKRECMGLGIVLFLSCYPLCTDYLLLGDDIYFHLMRIEGVKEGLEAGMFPVKIQPNWCEGNGYAVGVMYGDILLYVPAILRLAGATVQGAYRLYMILINVLTVGISYACFKGIWRDKGIGLMGCALYSLSLYRLMDGYSRSAVGEFSAMAFYPLIFYGLYLIYKKGEAGKAVPALVAGGAGLIQTHILSCGMACCGVIIVSVLLWKKTMRKQVWLAYVKAAGMILILNAWFIVPFLDYYLSMPLAVKNTGVPIQRTGVTLAKLFSLSSLAPNGTDGGDSYRLALSVGFSFLLVLVLFMWHYLQGEQDWEWKREGRLCAVLTASSLLLSTVYFPYDWFIEHAGSLGGLFSTLQFPWRFLAFATLFLTWMACMTMCRIKAENRKGMVYLLCAAAALQGLYGGGEMLTQRSGWIYDSSVLASGDLIGGEYLLEGTDVSQLLKGVETSGEGVAVTQAKREKGKIRMEVICSEEGYVEAPFLYYKGYRAVNKEGEEYPVVAGKNNQVRILLPQGIFDLTVEFREPFYWRAAEGISILSAVCILLFWWKKGRNSQAQQADAGLEG